MIVRVDRVWQPGQLQATWTGQPSIAGCFGWAECAAARLTFTLRALSSGQLVQDALQSRGVGLDDETVVVGVDWDALDGLAGGLLRGFDVGA